MNGLHQPFAETVAAIIFVDEDIAQIGKDGVIADDAGNDQSALRHRRRRRPASSAWRVRCVRADARLAQ